MPANPAEPRGVAQSRTGGSDDKMIVIPPTIHKFIASVSVALMLVAQPCLGREPTTIDTGGFSVTFGEKWHVSTDHKGTILGGVRGEEPPFIIMYYADPDTDRAKGILLEHMKQSSIADIMGDGMRRMIEDAKWHRHDTVHKPDGTTEERLDVEIFTRNDEGRTVEVCSFIRFYHDAPRAELYLVFTSDKPCAAARAEFDSFEKAIVWR